MEILTGDAFKRKHDKGLCCVKFCINPHRVYKQGKKVRKYKMCRKCESRLYRATQVLSSTYSILRQNAKRRGIPFTLTREWFYKFCKRTKYIEKKGRKGKHYTIDRDKPYLGYADGNLKLMTRINNSRKRWIDEKLYGNSKVFYCIEDEVQEQNGCDSGEEVPF